MEEHAFEARLAMIRDALRNSSPRDTSIGIGKTDRNDALDQLVEEIDSLLRRWAERMTAYQKAQEARLKLIFGPTGDGERQFSPEHSPLLDALEQNTFDTIYFKDLQSRFIFASRPLAGALNLEDTHGLIGLTDFDLFTEDHAREAFEDEQRIIRTGEPVVNKEEKQTAPGKAPRWVVTTKLPLRDRTGTIVGTFGISHDITERKQLEESLEKERTLLATLINNLPDYVSVKDTEGRILLTNAANAYVMGLESAQEAVGKTDMDFYPPQEASRYLEDERSIVETGMPLINKQEESFDPHGQRRWTLTTKMPLRDARGKILGVVCTGRDITDRRQAEKRIEDLARFPDENPNPVLRVSREGEILYANPCCRSLLPSWSDGNGARVPSEYRGEIERAWTSNEKQIMEVRDGARVFQFTIAPIPSGGYINLYGRDVTEERSLAEKFLQAQKMEAVGRLAGGIAHDFNNLLTVIGGYSSLLQEEIAEGNPTREQIDEIDRATRQAIGLTAQLLAFSRKQVMKPRLIDVNALVRAEEKIMARLLGEDIELRTSLQPDAGAIKADPGQMVQVLMNLVVNARDAMPRGGRLTIETSNETLDAAYVGEHAGLSPGQYVRVTVSDTGHGMDQEVYSHIFEPFFTTKGRGKGTGLGLSIVYGIVRQSNGSITCSSNPGVGTSFTIHFPRTFETDEKSEVPERVETSQSGGERILLVEDEETVRRFARIVLERNGYTVIEVSGGEEALSTVASTQCALDLVVTDVVMPQMSGKDLAQKIALACPSLKVLFMSGYTGDVMVHHGLLDPGIQFIAKPFTAKDFLAKVRHVLDEGAR